MTYYAYTCRACGKQFENEHTDRIYCSYACYRSKPHVYPYTKPCASCGKSFTVKKASQSGQKYCSRDCVPPGTIAGKNYIVKPCEYCHKDFTIKKTSCADQRFCSRTCASASSRTRMIKPCKHCGKMFLPQRDEVHHCSLWCAGFSRRKPNRRRKGYNFLNKQRQAIMTRDNWHCIHCGSTEKLEVDHTLPIYEGGRNEIDNGQTLCYSCHKAKTSAEKKRWAIERRMHRS